MEPSVAFSDPYRPVDIRDYVDFVSPVQVPVFSDSPDDPSMTAAAAS
ncbi:hypothetical protein [Mycobacterium sp. 155]|nr:hypothetical protein [Mycobacterium sp. 155]